MKSLLFFTLSWKRSAIIPLPKKSNACILNDFRPIALTPTLATCMERVIGQRMTASVGSLLDPMQFAYREKRGTEDATISLVHAIVHHLESPEAYVRVLFLDYSSAFNTTHTHILIKRMVDLSINGSFIHWIADFLTNRPQRVIVNSIVFYLHR